MREKNYIRFVIMLSCFMVACTQAGITMYSSSMPYLSKIFHVSYSYIVYTLTAYLLGYAIATLFFGGISDQIGRKKSYIIALIIFSLTSLLLAITHSILSFIVLRFLQGIGGGGCAIIGRASVRDICEGKQLVRGMSYISIAFIVSMGLFQYVGGLFQTFLSYQADFIFMSVLGVLGLIMIILNFEETSANESSKVTIYKLINDYRKIISEKFLPRIAIGGGLGYSLLITFNILGIYYLQNQLHVSPVIIGILGICFSIAYLFGTFITNLLLHVYDIIVLINIGKTLVFFSGIFSLLLYYFVNNSVTLIAIPVMIGLFGQALLYPCAMTVALHPYKNSAGAASSLFGFSQQFIGFFMSLIVGLLPSVYLISLGGTMFFIGIISFVLLSNRWMKSF